MTFISRVMGFVRDMIFAQLFGAQAGFDAFVVAFKIPNFMRRLFAEGAFSQAFVPILSEYRQTREPHEAKALINRTMAMLSLALLLFTLLAELLAPVIVMVFAPGFIDEPYRFTLATHMLYITLPYLLFVSLTAFCGAVLNSYGNFAVPSFTPVLLNICLIVAALVVAPHMSNPIMAIAWGVFVGGVVQLAFQLPFLYRKGLLPKPQLVWRDEGVRRILKLMVPALFGVSVAQISLLIDTLFASFLPVGSISWLYYSDRLTNFPLGIFGVALATVVLPHLSRQHAAGSVKTYSMALDWALRCVFIIAIPAAIGLYVLAGPLLATLFNYGAFNVHDVVMARLSLMAFAVGLPAFMLVKVLASGFYARQNIRTPVKIAAISVAANIVFNLILIKPLAHAGIALAVSLASMLNTGLLFIYLLRQQLFQLQPGWKLFFMRLVISSIIMAAVLWYGTAPLAQWMAWHWQERVVHLLAIVAGGGAVYFISLWVLGLRLRDFRTHFEME